VQLAAKPSTNGSQFLHYTIAPIVASAHLRSNCPPEDDACSLPAEGPSDPHMLTILVVILLLVALGALPSWPYSRGWGYYPSGGLGLIVLILVILLLMGRI
jgi:hypothetical protein